MESELSTPKTRRESEVWQACDDLWAQNATHRALTGDNIRDQLVKLGYKRGSPNEIYRYRTSWRESRGISEIADETPGEASASDPISRAVSLVYDQMRTQTHEAIDKLTSDYEEKLKAAQEQIKSQSSFIEELTAQRDELLANLNSSQQRGMQAEQDAVQARREQALISERLKAAQDQVAASKAEQERLLLELKTFHEREIDLWRSQNAELDTMLAAQKKEARTEAEKQGAAFSESLMALKIELRQAVEDKVMAEAKLAIVSKQESAIEERNKQILDLLLSGRDESLAWQRKVLRLLNRPSNAKRVERSIRCSRT